MNFFNDGYRTESLIFKKDGVDIGHVALKQSKQEPIVFLCFLLISHVERGKGLSKSIIKLTEQYLQIEYGVNEYYLNVLLENEIAINLYKSVGFNEVLRTQDRIRMKKILE
jgi:RimJ/RimL family protein N-acetyltransferase